MGLKVASKLLNRESRSFAQALLDIRYIPREKILKNPKNRVSIAGIEELAQDIKMAGLEQPLVVYPKDGKYVLLTGERRLTAIDRLIESGDWDPETDYIPCIERPLDLYKLPLNDDLKERYAILRTNAFNRKFTDADLLVQTEDYQKIVRELKKQGYKEMIIGYDDNGDPVKQDITGRTRSVVAGMVGVSTGQVSKIENILKNGSESVREAVADGEMSIAAASELASYDRETQEKFLEENDASGLTASDIHEKAGPLQLPEDKKGSKKICKNCISCKPSYQGGFCEMKNKKTKYSGTCDKWADKKITESPVTNHRPLGAESISDLDKQENKDTSSELKVTRINPSPEIITFDEFWEMIDTASRLCDELKGRVSENYALDEAITLIDEDLRPLLIRLQQAETV